VLAAAAVIGRSFSFQLLTASLAIAERSLERWDAALANLRQALQIYVNLGDREKIGKGFAELSDALILAGRFQEAAETARRGLNHLGTDISAERARLFASLEQAHALTRAYEPAQEALHEASNIASQLSDQKLEARLLGVRSTINFEFFRLRETA
jgi:tetratricopeptide (TPR) repeat protein